MLHQRNLAMCASFSQPQLLARCADHPLSIFVSFACLVPSILSYHKKRAKSSISSNFRFHPHHPSILAPHHHTDIAQQILRLGGDQTLDNTVVVVYNSIALIRLKGDNMSRNGRVHVATWLEKDSELYRSIVAEAEAMQVSISAIIRWALMDRYISPPTPQPVQEAEPA